MSRGRQEAPAGLTASGRLSGLAVEWAQPTAGLDSTWSADGAWIVTALS